MLPALMTPGGSAAVDFASGSLGEHREIPDPCSRSARRTMCGRGRRQGHTVDARPLLPRPAAPGARAKIRRFAPEVSGSRCETSTPSAYPPNTSYIEDYKGLVDGLARAERRADRARRRRLHDHAADDPGLPARRHRRGRRGRAGVPVGARAPGRARAAALDASDRVRASERRCRGQRTRAHPRPRSRRNAVAPPLRRRRLHQRGGARNIQTSAACFGAFLAEIR